MTVELLQMLSLGSYIMAGVLLLLSVALFFLLDVPKLYGDISGRNAKRAIEAIRQQNESNATRSYQSSPINASRSKLTDKITMSGKLETKTSGLYVSVGTEKFSTATLAQSAVNETTLLAESASETTLLSETANETTLLYQPANETTLLMTPTSETGKTEMLGQNVWTESVPVVNGAFSLEVELAFAESTEIIE